MWLGDKEAKFTSQEDFGQRVGQVEKGRMKTTCHMIFGCGLVARLHFSTLSPNEYGVNKYGKNAFTIYCKTKCEMHAKQLGKSIS